jgi:hypothetical protein
VTIPTPAYADVRTRISVKTIVEASINAGAGTGSGVHESIRTTGGKAKATDSLNSNKNGTGSANQWKSLYG